VQLVHKRIDAFAARWRDSYPAAVKDEAGVAWRVRVTRFVTITH
jgi:hypothetical protein